MKIKVIMSALMLISMNAFAVVGCVSCSEKAAIRKSIQEALAAKLAAEQAAAENKEATKNVVEACCQSCVQGLPCEGTQCERAPREAAANQDSPAFPSASECDFENIQEQLCLINEKIEALEVEVE